MRMDYLKKFYTIRRQEQSLSFTSLKKELYVKWIGTGKVILDAGCSDGISDVPLMEHGNTVYGIDIVDKEVEKARSKGVRALCMDLTEAPLPFEDNFFDVIIAGDIIEHVFDTDSLMREFYAKLKPGGHLILTTPNLASFGRRMLLLFAGILSANIPWRKRSKVLNRSDI